MRINKYLMPLTVLIVLLGTVLVARAAGYWQTSGRDMIDPDQPLTSADIKGWMPLEYVSDGLGIAPETLYQLLGIPEGTPLGTPLKDLEEVIEVSEVRTIIGAYLGELTPGPEAAPAATPAETEHVPGTGDGAAGGAGLTPLPAGEVLAASEIKGWMTLRQVGEQCGVPLEELKAELGLPDGVSPDAALRDLRAQVDGFEVELVREVVTALQSK